MTRNAVIFASSVVCGSAQLPVSRYVRRQYGATVAARKWLPTGSPTNMHCNGLRHVYGVTMQHPDGKALRILNAIISFTKLRRRRLSWCRRIGTSGGPSADDISLLWQYTVATDREQYFLPCVVLSL